MNEFRKEAVQTLVNKLFAESSFSICTLDQIIELTGATPNHGIRAELRAFHCVSYSQMSERTRQMLQEKVVECLRGDPFMNPARVTEMLTDEGQNFAFIEDRYLDSPKH